VFVFAPSPSTPYFFLVPLPPPSVPPLAADLPSPSLVLQRLSPGRQRRGCLLYTLYTVHNYLHIGVYRIFVRFIAFVNEPIIHEFIAPPPPAMPTLACNGITRLLRKVRPYPDPPSVCYRRHNIGDGNIV